jgi:hypothetical protein
MEISHPLLQKKEGELETTVPDMSYYPSTLELELPVVTLEGHDTK